MEIKLRVNKDTNLKELLKDNNFSNRTISKLLLEKKDIFINGIVYIKEYSLKEGDEVNIVLNEDTSVKMVDKEIDVVYEDEYILVVNKPSDLATIPSIAHYTDSLAGRVLYYFNKIGLSCGIHIVNRLDYQTRGLVIFAKSSYIHSLLSKEKIVKKYHAIVWGVLENKQGVISKPIAKSEEGIKRIVSANGQSAVTEYKVVGENDNTSLVDITLKTGRTHQIRVHFASIGHPLCGDELYGGGDGEYYLSSYYLSFNLAVNNKRYEVVLQENKNDKLY